MSAFDLAMAVSIMSSSSESSSSDDEEEIEKEEEELEEDKGKGKENMYSIESKSLIETFLSKTSQTLREALFACIHMKELYALAQCSRTLSFFIKHYLLKNYDLRVHQCTSLYTRGLYRLSGHTLCSSLDMELALITPASLLFNVLDSYILLKLSPFMMYTGYAVPWSFAKYATIILYKSLILEICDESVRSQVRRMERGLHCKFTDLSLRMSDTIAPYLRDATGKDIPELLEVVVNSLFTRDVVTSKYTYMTQGIGKSPTVDLLCKETYLCIETVWSCSKNDPNNSSCIHMAHHGSGGTIVPKMLVQCMSLSKDDQVLQDFNDFGHIKDHSSSDSATAHTSTQTTKLMDADSGSNGCNIS